MDRTEHDSKLTLEIILLTKNMDFMTAYNCLTVCRHVHKYAQEYLRGLLDLRIAYSNRLARAYYKKILGQPIDYTHSISTVQRVTEEPPGHHVYELFPYNRPFSDEFLAEHILAISGITLWIQDFDAAVNMKYSINVSEHTLYVGNTPRSTYAIPGTNITAVSLQYPNRHNPIPLIPGYTGYDAVSVRYFTYRIDHEHFGQMLAANFMTLPKQVVRIVTEYVYASNRGVDIDNYAVCFNGRINEYVRLHSLLVCDDPSRVWIAPPTPHQAWTGAALHIYGGATTGATGNITTGAADDS